MYNIITCSIADTLHHVLTKDVTFDLINNMILSSLILYE